MKKYRKKPVEIEAVQVTQRNGEEIESWIGASAKSYDVGMAPGMTHHIDIDTLEGTMRADVGDWIIKGVKGEFYPCKPDIFEATYEEVTE